MDEKYIALYFYYPSDGFIVKIIKARNIQLAHEKAWDYARVMSSPIPKNPSYVIVFNAKRALQLGKQIVRYAR